MRRGWTIPLLLVATVSLGGCTALRDFLIPPREMDKRTDQRSTRHASLVLHDVQLSAGRRASLAIRNGRIAAIGAREAMAPFIARGTTTVSAAGAWATPGFSDAHVHLEGSALLADALDLRGVASPDQLGARLKRRLGLVPLGGWVWGFGLEPSLQLDAAALEQRAPGLPVWLSASDGHSAVLSQALVARLPAKLRAEVSRARGRVSEALARRAWYALPSPAGERLKPFVVQLLARWARQGITQIDVMGARPSLIDLLEELDASGRLPLRCRLYLAWVAPDTAAIVARRTPKPRGPRGQRRGSQPLVGQVPTARPDRAHRRVEVVGVKVWLDGTLGAHTAALGTPYSDTQAAPTPTWTRSQLAALLRKLDAAGLQLAAHAIGDAALDRLLAARAGRASGAPAIRIEHAQVVRPDQLPKLRGMRCSVQPLHRAADAGFASARLGTARLPWAYRAASLAPTCPLLLGSDAPVAAVDPWRTVAALVAHPTAKERLTRAAALAAARSDAGTGRPRTIAVGQLADLVLWRKAPAPGVEVVGLVVGGTLDRR